MYVMLAAAVLGILGPVWRVTVEHLGGPRAPWNATWAALGLAYFITQGWYLLEKSSGRELSVGDLWMIDVLTVALVFCKAIARCPDQEYRTARQHLRCMVAAFTVPDRAVVAIFPLMWLVYVLRIDDFSRWWVLYGLAMAQFLVAGGEALNEWRKARVPADEPDTPSSGLMFAAVRAGARG